MANLQDLPEELVSNISLRLWSDDVQSLRLTCKTLEEKTLHEWATEYFDEKGFPITTDSLKVLLNIANSKKLKGYLHRIHILTAYFSDSAFASCGKTCSYGHACGWQPTIRQREAWNFFTRDQQELKASGKDREMLTEALSKLPGLKALFITDSTAGVPQEADIRMLRKVARLCGRNLMMPTTSKDKKEQTEHQKVLTHTWSITTTAIANAGKSTLKTFGTTLAKGSNALCIPSDIRFSDTKISNLKKALKHVDSTRFQLTTRVPPGAPRSRWQAVTKTAPNRLQNFASVFAALDSLSVDFEGSPADSTIFNNLMPRLDLSKMTKLNIHTLSIERKPFMAALERLVSVESLMLNFVNLTKGSWIPVLKLLQSMGEHLNHLHLMYLLEADKKAYFLKQLDEEEQNAMDDMNAFYDDMMAGVEDEMWDDDETDDEMPELEPMDADTGAGASATAPTTSMQTTVEDGAEPVMPNTAAGTDAAPSSTSYPFGVSMPPELPTNPPAVSAKPSKTSADDYHSTDDHKAPGNEEFPERGYWVCLEGKEKIKQQLATFIQEYNLGENIDQDGTPGMGALLGGGVIPIPVPPGMGPGGPPPNVNTILNGLAGYLGVPSALAGNGGAGAGGQGGQHGAAGANTGGGAQGNGNAAGAAANQATGGAAVPPGHPANLLAQMPPDLQDLLMNGPPPGMSDGWGSEGEETWESGSDEESDNSALD